MTVLYMEKSKAVYTWSDDLECHESIFCLVWWFQSAVCQLSVTDDPGSCVNLQVPAMIGLSFKFRKTKSGWFPRCYLLSCSWHSSVEVFLTPLPRPKDEIIRDSTLCFLYPFLSFVVFPPATYSKTVLFLLPIKSETLPHLLEEQGASHGTHCLCYV